MSLLYLPFFLFSVWSLRKEWFSKSLLISVLLVLVVSSLGLFPISLRLQLFLFVLFMIYVAYGMCNFVMNIAFNNVTAILSVFVVIVPLLLFSFLTLRGGAYHNGEEFKSCFNYAKSEVSKNDGMIYFPAITRPFAEYYIGYKQDNMEFEGPILEEGDYIWGSLYRIMKNNAPFQYNYIYDESAIAENVEVILKYDKVYIINCHTEAKSIEQLIGALEKYGKISTVYEFHHSYVYFFVKI